MIDADESGRLEVKELKDLLEVYEGWTYERNYKSAMEETYGSGSQELTIDVRVPVIKKFIKIMSGARYELVMNIVGIANVFSLVIK